MIYVHLTRKIRKLALVSILALNKIFFFWLYFHIKVKVYTRLLMPKRIRSHAITVMLYNLCRYVLD